MYELEGIAPPGDGGNDGWKKANDYATWAFKCVFMHADPTFAYAFLESKLGRAVKNVTHTRVNGARLPDSQLGPALARRGANVWCAGALGPKLWHKYRDPMKSRGLAAYMNPAALAAADTAADSAYNNM
eukprot:3440687-Pyramimonas_sp.AAC.1